MHTLLRAVRGAEENAECIACGSHIDLSTTTSTSHQWHSFTIQPENITSLSLELPLMRRWWEGKMTKWVSKWSKWRWVRKWRDRVTKGNATVFPHHDGRPLETFKMQVLLFSAVTPALCSPQQSLLLTIKWVNTNKVWQEAASLQVSEQLEQLEHATWLKNHRIVHWKVCDLMSPSSTVTGKL